MNPQNTLDLKGYFRIHPLAELIVEIGQAELTGSLRVSREDRKTVAYFKEGRVVYAVSNARPLRLYTVLLDAKKIDKQILAQYPEFANDVEFAKSLSQSGLLSDADIRSATIDQIDAVIIDALAWPDGEWTFSPLARVRDDLTFQTDVSRVLSEYGRSVSAHAIAPRFSGGQVAFAAAPLRRTRGLQQHEILVLDQFGDQPLTIEALRDSYPMPEAGLLQAVYVLWLGGLLIRSEWNAAFSPNKIEEILTAKVSLVKSVQKPVLPEPSPPEATPEEPDPTPKATPILPRIELSLGEYLNRVESAATYYDIFAVDKDAAFSDIKTAYFSMAKLFHPDRFHRVAEGDLRRIQIAFTELARAYETLKDSKSRESYDVKMSRELEAREKRRTAAASGGAGGLGSERGLESFEEGLRCLQDEEYEAAETHLSRAVHYNPQNPLYRAYYGKALAADDTQLHKAESEMQAAAKLDPANPTIRIMLAELFIEMNMLKRAEGELKRFLDIAPDNKEARSLLESLRK